MPRAEPDPPKRWPPLSVGSPAASTGSEPEQEHRLLDALLRGDRSAAEQLARSSYHLVFGYLFRLTAGDRELAADLCQETYRRAWASLASFERRSRFSSWLCTIAYRLFLNHRERAPRWTSVDDIPELRVTAPSRDLSPAMAAETAQRDRQLHEQVLALPEPLRSTVLTHYWAEISLPEIAAIHGVSAVAARKRLAKGLALLRSRLEGKSS